MDRCVMYHFEYIVVKNVVLVTDFVDNDSLFTQLQ